MKGGQGNSLKGWTNGGEDGQRMPQVGEHFMAEVFGDLQYYVGRHVGRNANGRILK